MRLSTKLLTLIAAFIVFVLSFDIMSNIRRQNTQRSTKLQRGYPPIGGFCNQVRDGTNVQVRKDVGQFLKRQIDIVISFLGLVFLSPFLFTIAGAIWLDSGWPILFMQDRVGLGGETFRVYKFRTMVVGAEKKGAGLYMVENDPRLTRLGNFLRRTSLDELPQLLNVLKGDESLIGPRPMLPVLVQKLNEHQYQRHAVRPGITGLAQVKGRNSLPWSKRIDLDLYYINHWSLLLDARILLETARVVLISDGVLMNQSAQDVDDL